ncbi:MAG: hypothetical protein M3O31_03810, partial [Acidobacteriota bacterium]|nr:hypothetical protein [Acidobacteriota bacterium]
LLPRSACLEQVYLSILQLALIQMKVLPTAKFNRGNITALRAICKVFADKVERNRKKKKGCNQA